MISNALLFSGVIAAMGKPVRNLLTDLPDIHGAQRRGRKGALLWWGVLGELNALLDISLKSLDAGLEELLLLLGHTIKDVNGLLSTVELDRALSVSCLNTLEI